MHQSQVAERTTKLLATLSPEVKVALCMLSDSFMQEGGEAVLASWLTKPHTTLTVIWLQPWESQQH